MTIIEKYKLKWAEIPDPIKKLIKTGSFLLIIWKILYTFWLEPNRILDGPLTTMVAEHSVIVLQTIWPSGDYAISKAITIDKADPQNLIEHLFILKDKKSTISIADNCNGLELMVLYDAFI